MSSPPPYPPPNNPLKRPSIVTSVSQPAGSNSKRQRMHPLRQTSFPANIDNENRTFSTAASDAGSVTGSFTGSLGGTSVDGVFSAARNKKRGRKSKADKERERDDATSVRGMDRLGSVDADGASVRGGAAGGAGGGDDGDDDEYFDEDDLFGREEGATDTEAEKKNLALLVDAFNPLQSERYDLFKRAKLRKESLRRIVNHALSQSVPASVVTTINGFTKLFAGEIIERARTVQAEWAIAHDQAAWAAFEAEEAAAEARAAEVAARTKASSATPTGATTSVTGGQLPIKQEPIDSNQFTPAPPTSSSTPIPQIPRPSSVPATGHQQPQHSLSNSNSNINQIPNPNRPKREFKPPPNPHRGQLLPSHLREALRRYKRNSDGGGVGFSGLSMGNLGVRGSVTWSAGSVGGRRIFR